MPDTVQTRLDASGEIVRAPSGISTAVRAPRRIEKQSAVTFVTGSEKTSATSFVSRPSPSSGKPTNENESGIASTKNAFSVSDDLPLELAQRTTIVPRPIGRSRSSISSPGRSGFGIRETRLPKPERLRRALLCLLFLL